MPQIREIEPSTRQLIESIVRDHLDGHAIEPCRIEVKVDIDGEESIEIGLCYALSERPVSPKNTMKMQSAVWQALVSAGEMRFPHLHHYFDDAQKIEGVRVAC